MQVTWGNLCHLILYLPGGSGCSPAPGATSSWPRGPWPICVCHRDGAAHTGSCCQGHERKDACWSEGPATDTKGELHEKHERTNELQTPDRGCKDPLPQRASAKVVEATRAKIYNKHPPQKAGLCFYDSFCNSNLWLEGGCLLGCLLSFLKKEASFL